MNQRQMERHLAAIPAANGALIVEINESDVAMTRTAVICLTLCLLSSTVFAQDWDYQESRNAIDGHIAYGAVQGIRYTTHDGRSGAAIIMLMCDGNLLRVAIVASDVFKMGRSRVSFHVGQTPPIETTMLAEKNSSGTAFSTDSASVFDKLKLQLPQGDILRISIDSDVLIEFETGDSQAVTKVAAKCGHQWKHLPPTHRQTSETKSAVGRFRTLSCPRNSTAVEG